MLETSISIRTILVLDPELNPEGVEFVREPGSPVDAVLIGLGQLDRVPPDVPCFVAVGEESIHPALQAGFTDFVSRPIDWPMLIERMAARRQQLKAHAFHDAVQDIARYLHHAEALLASTAHRELERQIVNAAALATGADGGWLFGVNAQGHLEPVEAVGYPLPRPEDLRDVKGLLHDAFTSRLEKCVGLAGDEDPAGLAPFERGKSTLLAVPLMSHGRCLGVVELARESGKPNFRQEQVGVAVQLGRLAAAVLAQHRHEERFTSLLVRSLNRVQAVHEEGKGRAELAAAFDKVTHEVRAADPGEAEILELVASLRALKRLGNSHIRFWKETLERYVSDVARP